MQQTPANGNPSSIDAAANKDAALASLAPYKKARRPLRVRVLWLSLWALLAALVFFLAGRALIRQLRDNRIHWEQVRLHWGWVAAGLVFLLGMRLINAVATRLIVRSMGSHVGARWTAGTVWVSAMGRYVPGKVISGLSSALILTRGGVPALTAVAVTLLFTALTVAMGMIFSLPLLLTQRVAQDMPHAWIAATALAAISVVLLHPHVFALLLNWAMQHLKGLQLPQRPALASYLVAVALIAVRALFLGVAVWCAARSFAPVHAVDFGVMLGVVSLAGVIGFLAVFVPAGLGVQEAVFMLVLPGVIGGDLESLGSRVALLAVLFRAMQIGADVIAGALGFYLLHNRSRFIHRQKLTASSNNGQEGDLVKGVVIRGPVNFGPNYMAHMTPALLAMAHKPNFFIVGEPKTGTTAMAEYLRQHPQVYVSPHKEPHFFARDLYFPPEWCIREEEKFIAQFARVTTEKAIGEASVWYLYSQAAARELKMFSPEARIIIMLRDPVDLMYSLHGQFLWNCNDDLVNFVDALDAQADRDRGLRIPPEAHAAFGLQYEKVATYSPQIRRYFDVFGRDRVLVLLYDDLAKDTAAVYRQVLEFLEIDPDFTTDFRPVNPSKPITLRLNRFLARHPGLRKTIHTVLPNRIIRQINYALPYILNTVRRPDRISNELRARLLPRFLPEIDQLEALLERDLGAWREVERARKRATQTA